MTHPTIFFTVKIKSARESLFRPFFYFFHGRKSGFHAHFLLHFQGQSKVITDAFFDFARGDFLFHGNEIAKFWYFSRKTIFFHGYKKKINFMEGASYIFSRIHFSIFTYVIWKKFLPTYLVFSREKIKNDGLKSENCQ